MNTYRWKAYYSNQIAIFVDLVDVEKQGLTKIEAEPIREGFNKISLALDGDKKPIFYKRVFCTMENGPYNVVYFLGYSLNDTTFLLSLNSNTGEIRIEDDLFK